MRRRKTTYNIIKIPGQVSKKVIKNVTPKSVISPDVLHTVIWICNLILVFVRKKNKNTLGPSLWDQGQLIILIESLCIMHACLLESNYRFRIYTLWHTSVHLDKMHNIKMSSYPVTVCHLAISYKTHTHHKNLGVKVWDK